MRYTTLLLCALALTMLASFSPGSTLIVTSRAFNNNGPIPRKYSCEGRNVSPSLEIANIPAGTRTLAITLHDPDAALSGGFTHWVVWNIPVKDVEKKIRRKYKGGEVGMNTMRENNYKGMCPPVGTHHYHFKVYALDTKLDIDKNTGKQGLEDKMRGHILAQGELVGVYIKRFSAPSGGKDRPK